MFSSLNKETLQKKNLYLQKIRDSFTNQGFLEVETPILTPKPGMEPHLTPFETTLTTPQKTTHNLYLNTSPELQMKKLLGAGFTHIFNLTKVFRNGEINGNNHNPEFTMLEWYRQNADYQDLMTDCENLIRSLIPTGQLTYQGHIIDLVPPWERVSIKELFQTHCNVDIESPDPFKNFDTAGCEDWDEKFFKVFLNHIEPKLGFKTPTFVYDYPATQAALAKKSTKNPFYSERVELYIAGLELANGFSELIDSHEQRQRLQEEQALRAKLNKTVFDIDEEFLASLESIRHSAAGIALGIDRLLMILLDKKSIEEVLLFPLNTMLDGYNN